MLAALLLLALQTPRPDVLVIVMDDVGYPDLAAVPTPNIDALAENGVSFTHGYAMPWCAPSRDSFLRGAVAGYFHGDACDSVVPANALPANTLTIADLMHVAGYTTGLFGKWHDGPVVNVPWEDAPIALGFDTWQAGIAANIRTPTCGQGNYTDWTRVDDGVVTEHETEWVDEAIRDTFLAWWGAHYGTPRFAVVSFQSAHEPYTSPPGHPPFFSNKDLYHEQIKAMDAWIGEIVAAVGSETWVFLWGDNGTPGCNPTTFACTNSVIGTPGSNGLRAKLTTYQRGVHVPFIVSGSDLPVRGTTSDAIVQPSDILATLAEALGISIPQMPGSCSFVPALEDPAGTGTRTHAFVFNPDTQDRAVIEIQWKLRTTPTTSELFDLQNDPTELTNLYGGPQYATEQARLEAILATLP
jgi:arylsulfatase A-like enzyme